ncbi:AfsR/SARP family transcriptional regulator [Kitasatospora sp. P5_F3]
MTLNCPASTAEHPRLSVLGPLSATVHDRPVRLGGPRPRALLAALILAEGALVPEEQLIDAVWGDNPPEKPRQAVQTYVSDLRRVLEPGRRAGEPPAVLLRGPSGYALAIGAAAVDAREFAELVFAADSTGSPGRALELADRALGLWNGPAYADLMDAPFLAAEIGRLEELRSIASERRVSARLALGDHRVSLVESRALTTEYPLRESGWALRALALYRCGRPAEALQILGAARRLLRDQLGTDPGPELSRLTQRVLAHDPALLLT